PSPSITATSCSARAPFIYLEAQVLLLRHSLPVPCAEFSQRFRGTKTRLEKLLSLTHTSHHHHPAAAAALSTKMSSSKDRVDRPEDDVDENDMLDADEAAEEIVNEGDDVAMDSDDDEAVELVLQNDSIAYFDLP